MTPINPGLQFVARLPEMSAAMPAKFSSFVTDFQSTLVERINMANLRTFIHSSAEQSCSEYILFECLYLVVKWMILARFIFLFEILKSDRLARNCN